MTMEEKRECEVAVAQVGRFACLNRGGGGILNEEKREEEESGGAKGHTKATRPDAERETGEGPLPISPKWKH